MKTTLHLTFIFLLAVSSLSAATLYVSSGMSIQQAVNRAAPGDLILVDDGVYAGGLVVGKAITLRSVNGSQFTVIDGGQTNQCASLTNGASLFGFTLTRGHDVNYTGGGGGGAYGGALYNCTVANNWAEMAGGGAYECVLYNCTVTGNFAWDAGGGVEYSALYNCTLSGNTCNIYGGGASGSTLYNCIVCFNTAPSGANHSSSTLNNCWTNDPLFVDYANGNLRLQSDSPCINAGNNDFLTTTTDLEGNPRIVSGTVDIGAYEYQGSGSVISYAWLQQYGLPTDGSADFLDSDHDGMDNWQECVCGTCPTNVQSALRLVSATPAGSNVTVTWQSVAGVNYFLGRSTNLASPFTHLASFIMGKAETTSYADTNAAGAGPFFYRVGVLPSGAN